MQKAMRLLVCCALGLTLGSCSDTKKKMEERQRARVEAKKQYEQSEEEKRKAEQPKIEPANLGPFWDDPSFGKVALGKPCPEGLWAIFPGPAPGEGEQQAANEANRATLAQAARQKTYVTKFSLPNGVALQDYVAKKRALPVELEGLVECIDGLGVVSIAWGEPTRVLRPPKDADEEEVPTQQAVWRAKPVYFSLPMSGPKEVEEFKSKHGVDLDARVVFRLTEVELDKAVQKTLKAYRPDAGEEMEDVDWGAGRLVHAQVLGIRLGTDHEKTALWEHKGPPDAPEKKSAKKKRRR